VAKQGALPVLTGHQYACFGGYDDTMSLTKDHNTNDIPVIPVTALQGEGEREREFDAGADASISKPLTFSELEARVASLIRLRECKEQTNIRRTPKNSITEGKSHNKARKDKDTLPTVLIVEDNKNGLSPTMSCLSDVQWRIRLARNGTEALDVVRKEKVDVILLDILVPEKDGFQVCRYIKENEETLPIQILILTCQEDLNSKIQSIELGADDYLVKPINENELRARIRSLIKRKTYLDRLRAETDETLRAATMDGLTGTYNHFYFKHFLEFEMKRSKRLRHSLALLMIDVDEFKAVNDTYGHLAGDQFLELTGDLIRKNIREIDLAARYGGDEFAVVLPYADLSTATQIARRILRAICDHDGTAIAAGTHHSVSIGVSVYPQHGASQEELICCADKALYAAKRNGKGRIGIYQMPDKMHAPGFKTGRASLGLKRQS
jgi:two-component system cell cycle response regulator